MWKIREIKKNARKILRNNIWTLIVLTLFITLTIGSNPLIEDWISNFNIIYDSVCSSEKVDGQQIASRIFIEYFNRATSKIVSNQTDGLINTYNEKHNIDDGVFYSIGDTISKTITKLKQGVQTISNDDIIITIYAAIFIWFIRNVINIIMINPILVGEKRIYLESKQYKKTRLKRILEVFKKENYFYVVKAMFRLNLYRFLWSFTFVGGIIKVYSYRMTSYIIAENPKISGKDAIRMSREMMNGNKLNSFKLDLSFIPWIILQFLTLGLAGIYINPFYRATYAELYCTLRREYITEKKYKFELLNDNKLFEENNLEMYPVDVKKKRERINYYRSYKSVSLASFFFIFSIAGWLWEVLLFLFKYGTLINRGSLYGPWLPIYGTGCTLIALLMYIPNFRKMTKNPIITFFFIMILCSLIEYLVSWFTDTTIGVVYWDYTRNFLNLNGRICLENCIFFGLGGTLCLYVIAPLLEEKLQRISIKKRLVIITILVTIFTADVCYSLIHPNMGEGITSFIQN